MAREASLDRSRFEVDIGRHAPSVGLWSGLTLGLISAVGLVAFLYPLFLSGASRSDALGNPHTDDAPLFFGLALALALAVGFSFSVGADVSRVLALAFSPVAGFCFSSSAVEVPAFAGAVFAD